MTGTCAASIALRRNVNKAVDEDGTVTSEVVTWVVTQMSNLHGCVLASPARALRARLDDDMLEETSRKRTAGINISALINLLQSKCANTITAQDLYNTISNFDRSTRMAGLMLRF